ncbi:MAG: efflux RND transporter periplasmic adaptor subunit [Candidatus Latescibacteria bacterium]|nr:efflux RND transporter periplasmic adaptor subunit [Candidatus Latescibacterota bacterium]NIM21437.1 efflux RND transporter periplasmic adaptor subunit [Candidatus Latescibacterota bacterium]NIO01999.1 efflux RND transporter periplasmic adaptor subunit [Candidatus Latescibacterota bacterium]NIO28811.1 efflux RND transporter periplasmic adaptor subunit [Candidatus Latescibacterota bacterium]NIO77641.1 efflux RND transporter periplasmic adaptor subunit [Candidatus Latescibacterota bacterium]
MTGIMAAALMPLVMGCGGGGESASPAHQGPGARAAGGHPGQQRPSQPPIPVAIEAATIGNISSYYASTATLEAEKEAEVLSRVSGVVEALGCEEGDLVGQGDVLLKIENDEYRFLLAQAEANTLNLKDRYERLKGMWDQKLVSAEEFQKVKNDLKSAEAAEGLARLNLSYTSVTAPFRGRVARRLVDVGQNVSIGSALFVLSDFDPLLARVHVPSKEFKKLKPDQPVQLVLDSNQARLQGRIKLVSPIIDPTSGTIKVTVEIPEYPPDTRPGDFAEVRIVTEKRTGVTLVPKIAVFTDRGDQIVYIAADSTAERRIVETGFEDDVYTQILSGVQSGESVVVRGQRSLKHGAPLKIMEDQPAKPKPTERTGS